MKEDFEKKFKPLPNGYMNPGISLSLLGLESALNQGFLISEVLTVYGPGEIKGLLQNL